MYFSDLSVNKTLEEKLTKKGFQQLTRIQEEIIPAIPRNENAFIAARKSEGKTLGLVVGLSEWLSRGMEEPEEGFSQAVVFAPSQDAVSRLCEEISFYAADINPHACYSLIASKSREMMEGAVREFRIIITTPEDFIRAMEWDLFTLENIRKAVIFDAQKISSGSGSSLHEITGKLTNAHFFVFSNDAFDCLLSPFHDGDKNWNYYVARPEPISHATVDQKVIHLSGDEKPAYAIQCIEDAIKQNTPGIVLVAEKKYTIENLEKNLKYHDIPLLTAYRPLKGPAQKEVFDALKNRSANVLVTSTENIRDFIFPYPVDLFFFEMPKTGDDYENTILKTSPKSKVRIFADEKDILALNNIEKYIKFKIPLGDIVDAYIENLSFVRIQWEYKKPERFDSRDRGGRSRDRNGQGRSRDGGRSRDDGKSRDGGRPPREGQKERDFSRPVAPRKEEREIQPEVASTPAERPPKRREKNVVPGPKPEWKPKQEKSAREFTRPESSNRNKKPYNKPQPRRDFSIDEEIKYQVILNRPVAKKSLFGKIAEIFTGKKKTEEIRISQKTLDRLEREERGASRSPRSSHSSHSPKQKNQRRDNHRPQNPKDRKPKNV